MIQAIKEIIFIFLPSPSKQIHDRPLMKLFSLALFVLPLDAIVSAIVFSRNSP